VPSGQQFINPHFFNLGTFNFKWRNNEINNPTATLPDQGRYFQWERTVTIGTASTMTVTLLYANPLKNLTVKGNLNINLVAELNGINRD
jgi:hypothetical protein